MENPNAKREDHIEQPSLRVKVLYIDRLKFRTSAFNVLRITMHRGSNHLG